MSTTREYSSAITAEEREILQALAKECGEAIDRGETFTERWLPRGRGLLTARSAAMRLAHTQDPKNKHYRNLVGEIMAATGLTRYPRRNATGCSRSWRARMRSCAGMLASPPTSGRSGSTRRPCGAAFRARARPAQAAGQI